MIVVGQPQTDPGQQSPTDVRFASSPLKVSKDLKSLLSPSGEPQYPAEIRLRKRVAPWNLRGLSGHLNRFVVPGDGREGDRG